MNPTNPLSLLLVVPDAVGGGPTRPPAGSRVAEKRRARRHCLGRGPSFAVRGLVPAILVILAATSCVTQKPVADLAAELADPDTTNRRRLAIVEQLRHEDIHETGGALLDLLAGFRSSFPGHVASGLPADKPTLEGRIQSEANAIWMAYLSGPGSTAEKAGYLSELLQARHDLEGRRILLQYLELECWDPVAEAPVSAIVGNREESREIRLAAVGVLMRRCDPNAYCASALALVREWPLDAPDGFGGSCGREMVYRFIVGRADSSVLSTESREAVIRLGFEIIRDGRALYPSYGYFVASQLGSLLGIHNQFKPDQSLPAYQGGARLSEAFYEDTVRAALDWAEANGY